MKHHYIPEFYLRHWVGGDGRFERYNRPVPSKIMVRRSYPSETGWMKDLYISPEGTRDPQWLEIDIFQVIDSRAAPVLQKLASDPPRDINAAERSAWTVFLRSLFHRTPENLRGTIASTAEIYEETVESSRERYAELRGPGDPETFDEYKNSLTILDMRRSALAIIPDLIVNSRIGQFLNNMHTRIFSLPGCAPDFLLSDDPIIRTNGLMNDGGHFAIPISPRNIFVSAWQEKTLNEIYRMKPTELVRVVNTSNVEGARHFVVARNHSQDRFIRNRFGKNPRPSILSAS